MRLATRVRRGLLLAWLLAVLVAGCTPRTRGPGDADVVSVQEDPAEAEKAYRRTLARDPDDAAAHLGLAGALAAQDDPAGADRHFTQALRLEPGWADRVAAARRAAAAPYTQAALLLVTQGRAPEAAPKLAAAGTIAPGDPEVSFARGRAAEAAGDLPGAVARYREAATRDPGNAGYGSALRDALVEAGRRAREAGDLEEAHRRLQEAARFDAGPEVQYLLGSISFELAEKSPGADRERLLDEAAAAFRNVIRARPEDRDASYNLGAVLLASRRFEEAVAWYRDLIVREPRDPELYLALSVAHSQMGRVEDARIEEAIGRALRANEPVDDPAEWARRSSARFPQSDLSRRYLRDGPPGEVQTYQRQEGGLVEVWFYWERGEAAAFRDGGRLGADFRFPRP